MSGGTVAWRRREKRHRLNGDDMFLLREQYESDVVLVVMATGPGLPDPPLIYKKQKISRGHTEMKFLDDLRQQGLDPRQRYDFRLFSNYSPCCKCARELISTLGEFINNGSAVRISYTQGYYTEFRFEVEEESKDWVMNLEGLENLQNAGFELHPQLDLPPDWRAQGLQIGDPSVFNQLQQVLPS